MATPGAGFTKQQVQAALPFQQVNLVVATERVPLETLHHGLHILRRLGIHIVLAGQSWLPMLQQSQVRGAKKTYQIPSAYPVQLWVRAWGLAGNASLAEQSKDGKASLSR